MNEVNEDLQREREKCSFDVRELTTIFDGGHEKTIQRKEREAMLKSTELFEGVPEEYLGHKERYENSIKKSVILFNQVRKMQNDGRTNINNYREVIGGLLCSAPTRDGSPLGIHYVMFMPAILNQGTQEQQDYWMRRAWNSNIIGSYAQTELGHGTFIRGLETTATYDPKTQEFVLNSPTLTSYKWWPGGLGQTTNYCIVVAQLYTRGQCHGVHSFMVQVRDEETHMPLPGIKIGDIGAKLGLNTINNGFLGLDNVRIPRNHMLMKHAQVLEDGTFVKSSNSKLIYGAMVFVRVVIVFDVVNHLTKAVTIATRYSAVRRQCQLKKGEPEVQILDYLTQQHKIFIGIAACYALKITGNMLWDTYYKVSDELNAGNIERLPELHALACCLKAVSTSESTRHIAGCRLACGGHGYMHASNLPMLYGQATAACTYEGDNTVLLLQTARFLLKCCSQVDKDQLTPTVAYFKHASSKGFCDKWQNNVDTIVKGLQMVALRKTASCAEIMKKKVTSGVSFEDAWNLTSVQLVAAAEAHCRVIIISTFNDEVKRLSMKISPELSVVLNQLNHLYAVFSALEKLNDLFMYTSLTKQDAENLKSCYEDLLQKIRPNAVSLVDAFDIEDAFLQSALGAYDGRVYERLMEEALKSPLNKEPVNESFHKYLKPFMQGKL